ncbi:hypothetical protein WN48_02742 [Eufriesea mexicana]|uniref:Uncharacterized protein n=1 Tax=Eufriesea mexicana TaxID=516756 RepID=A0A310SCZ0_9HYME|nr:hypothetical protein WN48_02742 [Eufriesea mexicana]
MESAYSAPSRKSRAIEPTDCGDKARPLQSGTTLRNLVNDFAVNTWISQLDQLLLSDESMFPRDQPRRIRGRTGGDEKSDEEVAREMKTGPDQREQKNQTILTQIKETCNTDRLDNKLINFKLPQNIKLSQIYTLKYKFHSKYLEPTMDHPSATNPINNSLGKPNLSNFLGPKNSNSKSFLKTSDLDFVQFIYDEKHSDTMGLASFL